MPKEKDRVNLGVWVSPQLKARFQRFAEDDQKTITTEVTNALEEYANKREGKPAPMLKPEVPK